MAITPWSFGPVQFPDNNIVGDLGVVIAAGTFVVVKRGVVTNINTGASDQFKIFLCRLAASPTNANTLIQLRTIGAGLNDVGPEWINLVLNPTDLIKGYNVANALNFNLSLNGFLFT